MRWVPFVFAFAALGACGTRTVLIEDEFDPVDAQADVIKRDAGRDVRDAVAKDTTPPPAFCPDASGTVLYVITETNDVSIFDPSTLKTTFVKNIECEGTLDHPYSLAHTGSSGLAYVALWTGGLYALDLAKMTCGETPYPHPDWPFFGMGLSFSNGTLYAAAFSWEQGDPQLWKFNLESYSKSTVAKTPESIGRCKLTEKNGRLFGLCAPSLLESAFVEIDPVTAKPISVEPMTEKVGVLTRGHSIAYAEGYFWLFSSIAADSTLISRYNETTKQLDYVGKVSGDVKGSIAAPPCIDAGK